MAFLRRVYFQKVIFLHRLASKCGHFDDLTILKLRAFSAPGQQDLEKFPNEFYVLTNAALHRTLNCIYSTLRHKGVTFPGRGKFGGVRFSEEARGALRAIADNLAFTRFQDAQLK